MPDERPFLFVAGARPNFVKIAPILDALRLRDAPRPLLVHTGQHYDFEMSGVFFEQLGIPAPDVHLRVGSAGHGAQTGLIMARFEEYVTALIRQPKAVVVVGDVNSTMACALVAVKMRVPVAHVEAGLRSFDRSMPEEINRVVTDAVSNLLLVSEPSGLENLRNEGVPDARVKYVGNVMIDSLVTHLPRAKLSGIVERLRLSPQNYAIITLHRPANVDSAVRLAALVDLIRRLTKQIPVVFPVHPRTELRLGELGLRESLLSAGVVLSPPLGYHEFIALMASARVVVSDSGGIQEESTYLNVPCVTMRSNTERPITVTLGTNSLVGDDVEATWIAVMAALAGKTRASSAIDGWDGHAATRVIDALISTT